MPFTFLFQGLIEFLIRFLQMFWRLRWIVVFLVVFAVFASLAGNYVYQNWPDEVDRGAIVLADESFGETASRVTYLPQGWNEDDSLWFYYTTQGSALLPYDFFMALEQAGSEVLFGDDRNINRFRYLTQKATHFNPDHLPVGFVKDSYKGKDYMGLTCAACHTAQVNYKETAIRIDGGPAMADIDGLTHALAEAMDETRNDAAKRARFVDAVLRRGNDYRAEEAVLEDLAIWTEQITNYNDVNHSDLKYGYARLDAFGRIYNRVLKHVINKAQMADILATARFGAIDDPAHLTQDQINDVLEGMDNAIIGSKGFREIVRRLTSTENGYPGLREADLKKLWRLLFNEPNAPVSYPFLWDVAQSDYVQWNGLASNAGPGPLGRNAGEVIGVFGILDWKDAGFRWSIPAFVSGQNRKHTKIDFESSINLTNLRRLESHLRSLMSPEWPVDVFGEIDTPKSAKGQRIYARYCQSCHEVIQRDNWDRKVIAHMTAVKSVGTDPRMAHNGVSASGRSGNFEYTYQKTDVGSVLIGESAPVVQILTSATQGVVATPDADRWPIRRFLDWLYTIVVSIADNDIKPSIKSGNYDPDTTAKPYQALRSYKARPLNGIWATAPYLHNGSVPNLYELLLPAKRSGDPKDGEYRSARFLVGSREFDPVKVGFISEGYTGGKEIDTKKAGNRNVGHEYSAGITLRPNGEQLPPLTKQERWDLLEYLKTL